MGLDCASDFRPDKSENRIKEDRIKEVLLYTLRVEVADRIGIPKRICVPKRIGVLKRIGMLNRKCCAGTMGMRTQRRPCVAEPSVRSTMYIPSRFSRNPSCVCEYT
jgi:hypothetical protein